jgi:hypothetical protein
VSNKDLPVLVLMYLVFIANNVSPRSNESFDELSVVTFSSCVQILGLIVHDAM